MSDATPRPWTCHEGFVRTVAGPWGIICECIAGFEDCPHDANANAALIVEAVNAHDRLLEEVRSLELNYQGAILCTVADMAELNRLQAMADAGAELKDALFAYQHRNDFEPAEVIEAENRIDRAIAKYEQEEDKQKWRSEITN